MVKGLIPSISDEGSGLFLLIGFPRFVRVIDDKTVMYPDKKDRNTGLLLQRITVFSS
ncbi:hypothetical protein [Ammoniphilus sp. 3BR4]|uniref:hypothetical protein n=1 Tax=Ammoniphilus sp. 3BR4 TaxID=3158265 RepID=UPI003466DE98